MNDLTIRHIKLLDGLRFSFRLLEYHHAAMYPACVAIPTDRSQLIPALASCWAFIDVLHRVRELAQAVPGLCGKSQERKRFLVSTALAEQCRHYIQHLRQKLAKPSADPRPVWGSLSWVDPNNLGMSHTVMFGAQIPNTQYTGAVFDMVERRWVSKVCLGVGDASFNFDPLFEEAVIFEKFIIPWMLARNPEGPRVTEELPTFTTCFLSRRDV